MIGKKMINKNEKRSKVMSSLVTAMLIISTLSAFLIALAPVASADPPVIWWNASWSYNKKITIDHTKVAGMLTNFPVLINITDTDLKNHAQANADDICFVNSDSTTKYNHEIESYNGATGQLIAWVNVTSISNVTDTVFYMYYGNSLCSSQQNVHGTWDAGYKLVYHLNETSTHSHDSTVNGNTGTWSSKVATATGKIGKGVDTTYSSPYGCIDFTDFTTTTRSLELWVNYDSLIYSRLNAVYYMYNTASSKVALSIYATDSTHLIMDINGETCAGGNVNIGSWKHIVLTYDSPTKAYACYVNSVLKASGTSVNDYDCLNKWLGYNNVNAPDVKLDEFRLSNVARSSAWVTTEYNNQNSTSTFMSFGNECTNSPPTIALASPANASTNQVLKPTCAIWANDTDSSTLTATWRENSTGSNVTRQVNSSFPANTICRFNYSGAVTNLTRYYWQVYVDDGRTNVSSGWYYFTTRANDTDLPASSVNAIDPYWKKAAATITATATDVTSGVKSVTLWYRWFSTDNSSWDGWVSSTTHTALPWSWGFAFSNGTGNYQFYSIAVDNATNTESKNQTAEASCGYDNAAPSSSVTAITPYWKITSPLNITATANDDGPSGLNSVTLLYRYRAMNSSGWDGWVQNITDTALPWNWTFTFSNGTGHYQFYSIAADNATNVESVPTGNGTANCGYDGDSPAAVIGVPIDDSYYNTMDTISGTCSDTGSSGVNTVNITIYNVTANEYWNGTAWSTSVHWFTTTLSGSPWSIWSYNSSAVTWQNASTYIVNATATDNASNVGTAVHSTFYYDTYNPTVTISMPVNGSYYKTMNAISGTCSDASGSGVNTVNITIYNVTANEYWNGTAWSTSVHWFTTTLSGSPWSIWSYNSSAVTWQNASTYIVNATATDNVTRVGTTDHNTFYYDTYGPVISSISSGTPSTTSATITWTTNEVATSNVEYGTTTAYGTWSNNSIYETSHSRTLTSLSSSTTYLYRVLSYDHAGNQNSSLGGTGTFTTASGGGGYTPPSYTPTARHGGPYTGTVGTAVQFDGSASTATSGRTISSYSWNFGDVATGTGAEPTHAYTTAGTYTVTLTVTDSQGSSGAASTTATISAIPAPPSETIPAQTLNDIEEDYGITLDEPFYANDTNGDGILDTFTDPNNVLTDVSYVNISGHASFLISTNGDNIPEFFWDTTTNTITPVNHNVGDILDTEVNADAKTITITVSIEKVNWTYIEIADQYPDNLALIVKTADGRTISSDMMWRTDGKIFILDDPSTEYLLIYSYVELPLFDITLELTPNSVSVGTDISALITLINVGDLGLVNGTVNYTLYKGTEIVWSSEEDVSVLSQKAYTKTISTDGLSPGSYTFKVVYSYTGGQTASAQGTFSIKAASEELPYLMWIVVIILILIIIIVIIVILWKKRIIYVEGAGEKKDNKQEESKK